MDSEGRTSLPGLFVCGEVSGGVDGASRMGGNALTNILVFGLRAGKASAEEPPTPSRVADAEIRMPERLLQSDREGVTPAEVRRELRGIVQEGLAPWRNEEGIERCLSKIEMLNVPRRALRIASSLDLLHAIELHGLHRTAEAVGRAALARKESRGVHFREDYPNERDEWKRRIRVLLEGGTVTAGIGN
jgi:succinate dehydrogenase/fumarate reductase flavoprotein subunit